MPSSYLEEIEEKILNNFDLTPKGIIDYLHLREPNFIKTTNYGHFGKDGLSWEKTDRVDDLKKYL